VEIYEKTLKVLGPQVQKLMAFSSEFDKRSLKYLSPTI